MRKYIIPALVVGIIFALALILLPTIKMEVYEDGSWRVNGTIPFTTAWHD